MITTTRPTRYRDARVDARMRLARRLGLLGLTAGAISLLQTVGHIADPAYLIPGLDDGSQHVHYHLARESLVSVAAFVVIVLGLFAGPAARTAQLWRTMLAAVLGYVAAMWSGIAAAGSAAPNTMALTVHMVSSAGLLCAAFVARPGFRAAAR
ncbi:hypothetical protein [Streptomyces tubercidicus]|uniref:hypothetical protein n=1 Tax=Streptomyces tubercidicus TaxID=47759 RepID=UPI003466BB60